LPQCQSLDAKTARRSGRGFVTRPLVRCSRADHTHGPSYCRHIGHGCKKAGTPGVKRHGNDRNRQPIRIPGTGIPTGRGITKLQVWDTDPAALEKFTNNLRPLGFDIHVASTAKDAVTGPDIITTCTADKTNATILKAESIGPGVHINAIGGDCPGKTELDAAILRRGNVFVEYTPQTRIEGEIQQMPADFSVTEFWQVLTIDGTDFFEDIDLIASPEDPKDLFGFIGALSPVGS
jgi:hypothetical protein